jgi:hypothetical protein
VATADKSITNQLKITAMQQYTEVLTLKITSTQKQTLDKLKSRNIKVAHFIRIAIAEKLQRDAKELIVKPKSDCPF